MSVVKCVRCGHRPCICLLPSSASMEAHMQASAARTTADNALRASQYLPKQLFWVPSTSVAWFFSL